MPKSIQYLYLKYYRHIKPDYDNSENHYSLESKRMSSFLKSENQGVGMFYDLPKVMQLSMGIAMTMTQVT